ncbi:hypothetical protein FD755_022461, partial [Muntiacus reevesi]
FRVIGPLDPIVAVLGGEAVLPCFLFPAVSAEDMELRWYRSNFLEAVFVYQNRQEQKEEQMAPYSGRTSLVGDLLNEGYAALRIQRVQASDNGLYTCFFRKGGFYKKAGLELKVAGVGSAPQVRITGPEEDGVRVVCTASGWFPKPQVQWRDLSGEKFLAFSEAHTQDAEGLFSVEAALVVRDSSVGNVTCSILNPVLGQEKAMAIFIPEPFFPQASPWKVVFSVSLTVLVILLLGAGCYTKREHSLKVQEMREKETLCQAREQDRQIKEEVLKDAAKLQEELERRKSAYLAAWRKAQLYAEATSDILLILAGICYYTVTIMWSSFTILTFSAKFKLHHFKIFSPYAISIGMVLFLQKSKKLFVFHLFSACHASLFECLHLWKPLHCLLPGSDFSSAVR